MSERMYVNSKFEVIETLSSGKYVYIVKRIGKKGNMYSSGNLETAIEKADEYLNIVRGD